MAAIREPEEVIEAVALRLVSAALIGTGVPAFGALAPAPAGLKRMDATCAIVGVDQADQIADILRSPARWTLTVEVRVERADDPDGELFVDCCRRVRAALAASLGDGCAILSDVANGWRCDGARLDSTDTLMEVNADTYTVTKAYTLTVTGLFT